MFQMIDITTFIEKDIFINELPYSVLSIKV